MALYSIFALLDYAIYKMASFVIRLIILIANTDFFTEKTIGEVFTKVYVVLGVLVLFKIVIACIQYMVNPDVFDDKDKGMAGILKKTVICIALLVLIQPLFSFALNMQMTIVSTIPGLVLGNSENLSAASYTLNKDTDPNGDTFRKNLDAIGNQVSGATIWSFATIKDKEEYPDANITSKLQTLEGKINAGETLTIDDFYNNITEGCEGGLFHLFDTKKCGIDYRIGISTAAGIFLLYVLVSMSLDVGIRTIKLGILEILAPIPIGSYVFSKDKLTKYFNIVKKVYLDLFVRLAVIYFIIFFVQKVIQSIGSGVQIANGAYKPDGLESSFIKVIIIISLFMFAKKAPEFICQVLGIEGGGFGDMADMFKPGRLGGLAAGAINPIRNAASNVRDAWKNNADMVDNRGGKIRRAIQHTRRGLNAARHGVGGLARGAVDAYAGTVNGEDWAKRNQRLQKSIGKSKKRTAEGYMKRTDNDMRLAAKDEKKEIKKDFKAQGMNLSKFMKAARKDAKVEVEKMKSKNAAKINELQHNIANGKVNGASKEQMEKWNEELLNLQSAQRSLSTKAGEQQAIDKLVDQKKKEIAQIAVRSKVENTRKQIAENTKRMQNIQSRLDDPMLSDRDRDIAAAEYAKLRNENMQLGAQITKEAQQAMETRFVSEIDRRIEIEENGLDKQRDISGWTIAKGKADAFFGGEGFTGKGYLDTADLLKNNRSSLYTGEAMTKMRQNADILVDVNGEPAKFTAKFTKAGVKTDITYADMADLKRKADNGTITQSELDRFGFENSAMVQSAFEDIEKQAAEAYVTANMAAADPSVHSDIKLKGNAPANTTIVEGIKRMKAAIASANIPPEERNKLLEELSENPGKFFKGASDRQEKMRTKGSRISAYNSGKKDSGS